MSSVIEGEVAVVGAGPAGCHAARSLAARGHDVLLLEESPGPRDDIVCTGIVGEEAFRRFRLPEEAVVDRVRKARFLSPSRAPVLHEPERPLARVVDRTAFDRALARKAVRAGADLRRGVAVRELSRSPDGVRLRAETEDGPVEVQCRAAVVATGGARWLHPDAGLGDPPGYVHGAHVDVPFEGADRTELHFGNDVAPGWFAWVVPFGDGRARLGLLVSQGARSWFRRFLASPSVRDRLRLPDGVTLDDVVRDRLRCRGIVQGPVRPSYADRVLAVGEAAGQVKTTTAGGIYYGLLGAELAAEVLSDRLRAGGEDALAAPSLAEYEERWIGRFGPEIRAGLRLQEIARRMGDEEIESLFAALSDGLGATVREVVRFDWHRPALRALFRHRALG